MRQGRLEWQSAAALALAVLLVAGFAAAQPKPPGAAPPPPAATGALSFPVAVPAPTVAGGPVPDLDLLFTAQVIGWIEPCG